MLADERALALVREWWNEGPVPDIGSAALMDDVWSLFAHLQANGYAIVPIEWRAAKEET